MSAKGNRMISKSYQEAASANCTSLEVRTFLPPFTGVRAECTSDAVKCNSGAVGLNSNLLIMRMLAAIKGWHSFRYRERMLSLAQSHTDSQVSPIATGRIISFPTSVRQMPPSKPLSSSPDFVYLLRVISFLKEERKNQRITTSEVERRSQLKKGAIHKAEAEGVIPMSRDFKSWASALGFSWDEVWSHALKKA